MRCTSFCVLLPVAICPKQYSNCFELYLSRIFYLLLLSLCRSLPASVAFQGYDLSFPNTPSSTILLPNINHILTLSSAGPASTSMDGPVTYARAMRGEIPMRPGNPDQALRTAPNQSVDAKSGGKDIMDEEGLKLRLELNLDIEIELKASIHGDLTLALL